MPLTYSGSGDIIQNDIPRIKNEAVPSNLQEDPVVNERELNQESVNPGAEPIPNLAEDSDTLSQTEIQIQSPQVIRKSSRVRVEPKRLNIDTWKGKSYEASGVYNNHRCVGRSSLLTAPYSVGHKNDLHHIVPVGGGGIYGYGEGGCN